MKLLFPTVIHELKVGNFRSIKKELMDYVYDQHDRDPKGLNLSNMGGWQSQPIYFNHKNILLSIVTETLQSYFSKGVLGEGEEFTYKGLWMNINRKGDYNTTHDHPLSHMAGVFWIKTPKDCGNLILENPRHFVCAHEMRRYSDDFRSLTNSYPSYLITPTEGDITLFPSSLSHRVEVNESDDDRISASFNLIFKT